MNINFTVLISGQEYWFGLIFYYILYQILIATNCRYILGRLELFKLQLQFKILTICSNFSLMVRLFQDIYINYTNIFIL